MTKSKEYKECVKVYNKIWKIDISPETSFYDSTVYHQDACEEVINEAWHYEMECEGDCTKDIEDCLDTLKRILKYMQSAEKTSKLLLETQSLAIV